MVGQDGAMSVSALKVLSAYGKGNTIGRAHHLSISISNLARNEAGNSVPGLLGGALVIVCRCPGRGPQKFRDVRKR
jgi:hypothetical protein